MSFLFVYNFYVWIISRYRFPSAAWGSVKFPQENQDKSRVEKKEDDLGSLWDLLGQCAHERKGTKKGSLFSKTSRLFLKPAPLRDVQNPVRTSSGIYWILKIQNFEARFFLLDILRMNEENARYDRKFQHQPDDPMAAKYYLYVVDFRKVAFL